MANSTGENLIGEKLGNYRLERLLGRGRMGVVYLAQDEALLRSTAVKVLSWAVSDAVGQNPEAWFISEARNAARINPPPVVQIYGVARHGPHCYIAMEYVDGSSADCWIRRKGVFSLERATELLIHVADALQAAHEANVIHRDVKPENLLLRSDGRAKLGDFGMAVDITRSGGAAAVRAGTPYYTAPEIWRGSVASIASDIYALGATYYYLLTGCPPFQARELADLVAAHLNAPIPALPPIHTSVPPVCQAILNRCLAKLPNHRYANAQALALEARALLTQLTDPIPPPSSAISVPISAPPPTQAKASTNSWPASDWRSYFGCVRDPFINQPGE
ncbi:MAG TPA: serine/threonine-protein kinase, partial [Polyangiaceae bacterium]